MSLINVCELRLRRFLAKLCNEISNVGNQCVRVEFEQVSRKVAKMTHPQIRRRIRGRVSKEYAEEY